MLTFHRGGVRNLCNDVQVSVMGGCYCILARFLLVHCGIFCSVASCTVRFLVPCRSSYRTVSCTVWFLLQHSSFLYSTVSCTAGFLAQRGILYSVASCSTVRLHVQHGISYCGVSCTSRFLIPRGFLYSVLSLHTQQQNCPMAHT